MGKLNPGEIMNRVKEEGFESVWRESARFLLKPTRRLTFAGERGSSHPLFDLIQRFRQSFLDLGFDEVLNPVIVDEREVYKQYGPEALIILDRCYYLAALPRPDVGLSSTKRHEIKLLGVELTDEKAEALRRALRGYKRGEVDSDDLVEEVAEALSVSDSTAMTILSNVFPEFKALKPEISTLTLRSHMTSAWFLTLEALQYKRKLPIKLFSVDIRFRREQKEDEKHLRAHHVASCVIMDESVDIRDGEVISRALLEPLGLTKLRFIQKKVTSKYYAPETEHEGYALHPVTNEWIEVVNYGLYSPIALAEYGLEYPVLNVGIGVERVALALHGEIDLRRLAYPQFYVEWKFSDVEIAKMIDIDLRPSSAVGLAVKEAIISTALKYADALGPCKFLAYEGEILGKTVRVYVYETDVGAKLLGPAALNYIYVYDGNVLGVPKKGMEHVKLVSEALERGMSTGISYLEAIAHLAAAKVEEAIRSGRNVVNVRVKMAKHPSDVNIKIDEVARMYIVSAGKRIEVTGPVFVGVMAEVIEVDTLHG